MHFSFRHNNALENARSSILHSYIFFSILLRNIILIYNIVTCVKGCAVVAPFSGNRCTSVSSNRFFYPSTSTDQVKFPLRQKKLSQVCRWANVIRFLNVFYFTEYGTHVAVKITLTQQFSEVCHYIMLNFKTGQKISEFKHFITTYNFFEIM